MAFSNEFDVDMTGRLSEICHYKAETGTFYVQAPKFDELHSILASIGYDISFDMDGEASYDKTRRVSITYDDEKLVFHVSFPKYPSYPLFTRVTTKNWTWMNMARRVTKDAPVYEIKHVYALIEAIPWLEKEGYTVSMTGSVKSFFPPERSTAVGIEKMHKSESLVLKPHQEDAVDKIEKLGWKGVIGDDVGMGKTIEGGEIIWKLYNLGKVRRVLWVGPTSALVSQVIDEMAGRYGLTGIIVTGETMKPRERLGIEKKQVTGPTIYEQHGFVAMTWAMFVKDFAGKTFHEITKKVHFDLVILDEGHRCQHGNRAQDAALNLSAPFRVMLSGTIMPNGDWKELHNMVTTISPSSVMAPWYFANIEEQKEQDLTMDPSVKYPRYEAKKQVAAIVLAMLMRKVTRHAKEDCASLLPKLVEATVHVFPKDAEEKVIEIMIEMLRDIIGTWQSSMSMRNGSKDEKKYYKTIENAKNITWNALRRFCSNDSLKLTDWVDNATAGQLPVHAWVGENFPSQLKQIRVLLDSGNIRPQPKNDKVLSTLDQVKADRCLIFNNSVLGCIELSKLLKSNGYNVRVIVGDDSQFSDDDADELEQSSNIDNAEIESIIEWFWFPWKTISKLSSIDPSLDVTFVAENGDRKKSLYYVDGYKLGKKFNIEIRWKNGMIIPNAVAEKIAATVVDLKKSPSIDASLLVGANAGTALIVINVALTKNKDRRILVTTDMLNEGVNLQIASLVVFYDHPLSIKQREQRVARSRRLESMHDSVGLVTVMLGLDYAIGKTLALKYDAAKQFGGYPDPTPVSIKDVLAMVKKASREKNKQVDVLDFVTKAAGSDDT
jgi:superfamily II DNA or RNA helicase